MAAKPKKGPKYLVPSPKSANPPKPVQPIHKPVSLSFQFHREGEQYCLSHCEKEDIRAYLQSLRLLNTMTWMDVIKTGGKPYGGKVSLGYTVYKDLKFDEVSQDIMISGLRAGERPRIYGYHLDNIYYIVRFDPRHELVPAR